MRTVLSLALALGLSGSALAYGYGDRPGGYAVQPAGNVHYGYGEVLEARPVYRTVQRPTSERVCWEQPVEYYERGRPASPAGTIVGAIIGGAVGSHFGRGNGRRAATVAGAALGGSVGYNASSRGGYVSRGYEQRCEVQRGWQEAHDVVGYDITYRYRGEIYQTRSDHHPGDSIRVRVAVDAAP